MAPAGARPRAVGGAERVASTGAGSSRGSGTTTCTSRSGRRPRAASTCPVPRSAAEAAALVRQRGRRRSGDEPLVGFGFHDALWPDTPDRERCSTMRRRIAARGADRRRPALLLAELRGGQAVRARHGRRPRSGGAARGRELRRHRHCSPPPTTRRSTAGRRRRLPRPRVAASSASSTSRRLEPRRLDAPDRPPAHPDSPARRVRHLRAITSTGRSPTRTPHRRHDRGHRRPAHRRAVQGHHRRLAQHPHRALCSHPYPDGGHGVANLSYRRAGRADAVAHPAHGLEPAVHAIGDEANRLALDAFEAARRAGTHRARPAARRRPTSRGSPRLGVTASVQPEHAMDDRDVADALWAGRDRPRVPARRRCTRAGARLAFGSDAPVAPLDPWVAIAAAVARSRDGRAPWHPEQAVSAAVALARIHPVHRRAGAAGRSRRGRRATRSPATRRDAPRDARGGDPARRPLHARHHPLMPVHWSRLAVSRQVGTAIRDQSARRVRRG